MQLLLNLSGLLAALAISFISSGMETALYCVSRVRMRIRSERGEGGAGMVLRALDRLDAMVTAILINNNIAAYAGAYFLTLQLSGWKIAHPELFATAVITPVFFVLTESLPKQLAYNNADAFATALIRAFAVLGKVFSPMTRILNACSALLRRALGSDNDATLSRSQRGMLLEHLRAGVAENILTEEQNRMAVRIMQMEGISAGDSMLPLRRLTLLPAGTTRAGALAEMSRRRARFALLADAAGRPTDRLVTAAAMLMRPDEPWRPAERVAENLERVRVGAAIPEVLNLLRSRHARHAAVVRGNRVVGLITAQSVLDRIAGIGAQSTYPEFSRH